MLVLFVEDDAMNRRVVRDMLRVVDTAMEEAEEAETGLRMLAATPYDMVLMDLRMPGMDGITAIRKLRDQPGPNQAAPVVVITADMAPDLRDRCLAAGADEVIVKPVAMATLLDTMARLVPSVTDDDFLID
ncbi:response regulator [Croceibacterium sp. TMG7-5b_MA50]|uniref:response regulator n=1 Tax=Croceibacterium sp. TMG7-5b_MA50 TaxID=3121290 RepID=UPI0032220F53